MNTERRDKLIALIQLVMPTDLEAADNTKTIPVKDIIVARDIILNLLQIDPFSNSLNSALDVLDWVLNTGTVESNAFDKWLDSKIEFLIKVTERKIDETFKNSTPS